MSLGISEVTDFYAMKDGILLPCACFGEISPAVWPARAGGRLFGCYL
jgi:hypothetical protein